MQKMMDLAVAAHDVLNQVRLNETGDGDAAVAIAPEQIAQLARLADVLTPSSRLVLKMDEASSGLVLWLEGIKGPIESDDALLEALEFMAGLAGGNSRFVSALSASSECRVDIPYAPMRLIRGADGKASWCCTHDSGPHCSPAR